MEYGTALVVVRGYPAAVFLSSYRLRTPVLILRFFIRGSSFCPLEAIFYMSPSPCARMRIYA